MRRIVLTVLLPLLAVSACRPSGTELAIRQQLIDFPESRAQDFYKSFCQDNLGPEHLIPDPAAAARYLQEELHTYRDDLDSARYDAPELQYYPVGDEGNYVRVDLSVILDSLVDEKAFLDAFVRSANEGTKAPEEEWALKWQGVAKILRKGHAERGGTVGDGAAQKDHMLALKGAVCLFTQLLRVILFRVAGHFGQGKRIQLALKSIAHAAQNGKNEHKDQYNLSHFFSTFMIMITFQLLFCCVT